jgi:hypothetical protein
MKKYFNLFFVFFIFIIKPINANAFFGWFEILWNCCSPSFNCVLCSQDDTLFAIGVQNNTINNRPIYYTLSPINCSTNNSTIAHCVNIDLPNGETPERMSDKTRKMVDSKLKSAGFLKTSSQAKKATNDDMRFFNLNIKPKK